MLLASSLDSFPGKGERVPMDFSPNWGEGKIFDWYRGLPVKTMTKLEIRITNTGGVPHRFALAHMSDGSICRFDRRPLDPNAIRLLAETATTPERRAADEADHITSPEKKALVAVGSRQEVEITLPQEADVDLVLSACYAMSQDPKASIYALREYNCYFFAWTITMIVMRHTLPFTLPSPEDVRTRLEKKLDMFTETLTDKIVDALLQMVLDTITQFKRATGRKLYSGLSKRELAVWGLPVPVVHAFLRTCLRLRLHFGLKAQLEKRVSLQLQDRATQILEAVLKKNEVATHLEDRLWLFDLNEVFSAPVQSQILEILWDSLLDALSEGYGDLTQDFNQDIDNLPTLHRLKYRFFGKNVMQFSQLWNAALHAALPAARTGGHGKYTPAMTHAVMFDMAFKAGCDAALKAAKQVVRETSPQLNDPKRDKMWDTVWEVWNPVWEDTRVNAQKMAVKLIEETMKQIVDWVTSDVVKELGNNKVQMIDGTVQFKACTSKHLAFTLLKPEQIREFIGAVFGQTPGHQKNIEIAMANAWDKSHRTYVPVAKLAEHSTISK
ncbi:hypothetical protein RhiJN_23317 [Ceratobasidium sp. AG-Ba]|nr:hypothetical protein RhiJN_23317 [Ceratobasidium sp. AG-Ba]